METVWESNHDKMHEIRELIKEKRTTITQGKVLIAMKRAELGYLKGKVCPKKRDNNQGQW